MDGPGKGKGGQEEAQREEGPTRAQGPGGRYKSGSRAKGPISAKIPGPGGIHVSKAPGPSAQGDSI